MTDARWNRSRGRSTPQRQWSGGGWRWLRSRFSREHPGSTASSWTRSWSPSCTKSGEWGAAEIAASLDVGLQLVLRTLHDHGVPVRRGGSPPRTPSRATIDPRLTALYADPEITTMLRRHRIPRREQPGSITDRSPDPAPTTERFLREAYVEIGLAATHIEQLTGQPAERILGLLHARSMPVRPAGAFSPWYLRHRPQAQGGRPASRRR